MEGVSYYGDIQVRLQGRWATLTYPFPDGLSGYFAFRPKGYQFMPSFRTGRWSGSLSLMQGCRVPAELFLAYQQQIEREEEIRFAVQDLRKAPEYHALTPVAIPGIPSVLPHQWAAVRAMRLAKAGGLVLNATGTGKTLIAGVYLRFLKGAAVFVVDELTLMYQAKQALEEILGERVGVVGESQFTPERVTVATIQTLSLGRGGAFRKWATGLQAMIIDEVHLALNVRQYRVVQRFLPRAVYGLTATLDLEETETRLKAFGMCGPVLCRYDYLAGVAGKMLTPGVVCCLDIRRELENDPDYAKQYRDRIVNDLERNQVIERVVRAGLASGRRVVVLLERVAHIESFSRRFADVPHEAVYGKREVEERLEAKQQFEAGTIRLLIANKVFKKGINIKAIDMIVDGASMRSRNDAIQKYGRGVRRAQQKTGLIYVDVGEGTQGSMFYKRQYERRSAFKDIGVPMLRFVDLRNPEFLLKRAAERIEKLRT